MFECATTGHRRAVRHTGRLLPNVLVLAKEISPDGTPELPAEPQPEPEPEPIEDELYSLRNRRQILTEGPKK